MQLIFIRTDPFYTMGIAVRKSCIPRETASRSREQVKTLYTVNVYLQVLVSKYQNDRQYSRSAADLTLHCWLKHVCPNTSSKQGNRMKIRFQLRSKYRIILTLAEETSLKKYPKYHFQNRSYS